MDIVKYVKQDGTGDYTDIFTGFSDMLSSGVASSGDILTYLMIVDGGNYSGSFSGYIPYTGVFNIYSSGLATIYPTSTSSLSGIYINNIPNFILDNFLIDCQNISDYAFNCYSGLSIGLYNTELINCDYGIELDGGSLILDNVSSNGSGIGSFINGSGYVNILKSKISDYSSGIYTNQLELSESIIFNNSINIKTFNEHYTSLSNTLIYGGDYGIYAASGYLHCYKSTISNTLPIYSNGSYVSIRSCILSGNISSISGTYASGSLGKDTCFYPTGIYTGLNNINISSDDPKFNNPSLGDYRLKFGDYIGSPYIEHINNISYASGVNISIDERQFRIYDDKGLETNGESLNYIYKQGSSIRFTDYNKEIKFSKYISNKKGIGYQQLSNAIFSEYNIITKSSFSRQESIIDESPYDWDWKKIETTKITDDNYRLVPRSFIDIDSIIKRNIKNNIIDNIWGSLSKKYINVYDQTKYKGIAFDNKLSENGTSIMWVIDGNNQMLIKQNAFTGENLDRYPLFSLSTYRNTVLPSGIIPVSANDDKFRFILKDDPNKEIIADNQKGYFQWLPCDINPMIDVRGIASFKDYLFVTGSEYFSPIESRSTIPSGDAIGALYWYNNNDLYYEYTKVPSGHILPSGNNYPTDITIYEDGSLLVADAFSNKVYKYRPAYDYALIENFYDNDTRVLLRERYNNVEI